MNLFLEAMREYFAPVLWCWRALRRAAAWVKYETCGGLFSGGRRRQLASGTVEFYGSGARVDVGDE